MAEPGALTVDAVDPQRVGFLDQGRGRWLLSSVVAEPLPASPGYPDYGLELLGADQVLAARLGLLFAALQPRAVPRPADLSGRAATVVALLSGDPVLGSAAAALVVRQGQIRPAPGGGLALLPQGARSRGFRLDDRMLVLRGHVGPWLDSDPLLLSVPRPEPLDVAAVGLLPDTEGSCAEPPDAVSLTVAGTVSVAGEPVPGAVWSFTDRQGPPDDPATILNGFLRVPPGSRWVSEHGSTYLGDLQRQPVGVVPTPPGLRFGDLLAEADPLLDAGSGADLAPPPAGPDR